MTTQRLLQLRAPLSGVVVPLEQVPDPVFSQRLVGDGVSIDPLSAELLAPCDATVVQVHRAAHALTLAAHGVEIMMHIGLDTVNLKGAGFTARVRAGEVVKAGQPLISFDADAVATRARSLLTQIIIPNTEAVALTIPARTTVSAGRDVLLELAINAESGVAAGAAATDHALESDPIVVKHETGLHARPAALIAAAARKFESEVRLVKGEREANARSVVGIMSLEVMGGDQVRVAARGSDAAEAVAAVIAALQEDSSEPATPVAAPTVQESSAQAEDVLRGVPAAPGIAAGAVYQLRYEDSEVPARASDPQHERRALEAALATAARQLDALHARVAAEADAERASIFSAHQELLDDPELLDVAYEHIRTGASAAYAWRAAYTQQAERLTGIGNPLFAARATDMRDVGRRVLHLLIEKHDQPLDLPSGCILIAEDLTPSETATLDRSRVRGICTSMGSATSHAAILARALGIAAIAGTDPAVLELPVGTRVIVDGDRGLLYVRPTREQEASFEQRARAAAARHADDLAHAQAPAHTRDGQHIEIVGNIGDRHDAEQVVALGGEGVGLLRTEFLFMDRHQPPDEEEQAHAYQAIAAVLGPDRILVMRTLDVGGDKPLSYLPMGAEANPFLGERGIRLLLNRTDVLHTQLRAMLRAARGARIAIMFPMIATINEWRAARAAVDMECQALGIRAPQIGIMVETAAAALLAEHFAAEADFFSIGTNDLTQYTLAMDRTNPALAAQLDGLHPAVLRLIEHTVAGARRHQRWVGVCGALAGEPQAVPVLLGLGVHELSVSVPAIPATKARVRSLSMSECRETAHLALQAADAQEVRAIVTRRHGEA